MSVFYNRIDKKIKNEVQNQVNEKVSKDVIEMILKHSSKTASPLTLNEVGTSTIEKMKGREWLNENIDALYKEFEDIDDEYDIQERSKEVLLEWKDKIINDRKKLLYSTGTSINEFIAVMSLVLRDMVFEKRGYKEVQHKK
ncbi:MAG: hypothetical protein F4X82_00055 [Candidatus Spechtbacteria bacterium SB0662_bin_43]|uniref:Uncharacterized protein n=1 Tax=Candidatus Spechtbacteria bacterium SB0662_bin_43 TaxID=2604897 RepID=A0A845DI81_9BACT|nr:hypothetical protein [Candidatus Spechtbacteria bacterium SB0662_bin_43]